MNTLESAPVRVGVIGNPNPLHVDTAIECLSAGVAVLLHRHPMAPSVPNLAKYSYSPSAPRRLALAAVALVSAGAAGRIVPPSTRALRRSGARGRGPLVSAADAAGALALVGAAALSAQRGETVAVARFRVSRSGDQRL